MSTELVVEPDELVRLSRASSSPGRELLEDAIRGSRRQLRATSRMSAPELLRTYRVRLQRWMEEGVPTSVGMPEFVEALEAAGDADVVVADYHFNERTFVVLLTGRMDEMLGCVAIDNRMPPG